MNTYSELRKEIRNIITEPDIKNELKLMRIWEIVK